MPPETIKLSQAARDQLITVKRRTGVSNWNVLSRWGYVLSLAESTDPPVVRHPADSSIEMTWKTFGGARADIYWLVLVQRHLDRGLSVEEDALQNSFRLHLHRGIAYLNGHSSARDIGGLVALSLGAKGNG